MGNDRDDYVQIGGKLGRNVTLNWNAGNIAPLAEDITIGTGTNLNGPFMIRGKSSCSIGKYCAIGWHLHVITDNHDMRMANVHAGLQFKLGCRDSRYSKGPVKIGNSVWIGDNVTIIDGVTVGDGAVIGAGAVVISDVEPYSVVVGVPARFVKKRFSDKIITQLLELRWWDWSFEKMKRNKEFFHLDLTVDGDLDLAEMINP